MNTSHNPSRVLHNLNSIPFIPLLAEAFGLREALFIQQIHYWVTHKENAPHDYKSSFLGGYFWWYATFEDLAEEYPFLGHPNHIRRMVKGLCDKGAIVKIKPHVSKGDHTSWYRLNHEVIEDAYLSARSKSIERKQQRKLLKESAADTFAKEAVEKAERRGSESVNNLLEPINKMRKGVNLNDNPINKMRGSIHKTPTESSSENTFYCPPSDEDVQTPKDKKAVLAQLMQKTEEKYSQTKQGKKTPKRKLYDFWNHCFYQKYGMRQEFDVKQDQNYQKLIDLTGDFDKAKKLVEFYIENYETLPFVNTLSYKRPLIKGLLVFAHDVNDMMNEPTADLDESTPDTEEQQQALQDYLEREAKQKAIQETHAQLGKLAQEAFEQLSSTFVSNEAFASRLKQTSSLYTLSKANGALSFVNMQTIVDGVYELKTGHKYSEQEKSIFNRLTQLKRDSRLPDDVRFMKLTYKEEVENFYKLITSSKELDFSKVKISSDPIFSDDHVYLVDGQDTFEETIFEVLKQIPVISSRLMVGGGNLRTYLSLIAKMAFENGEAYVSFAGIGKI